MLPIKFDSNDDFFEKINEFVLTEKPDDHSYAVYVLELQKPTEQYLRSYHRKLERESEEAFKKHLEDVEYPDEQIEIMKTNRENEPSYFEQSPITVYMLEADEIYYVGQTSNLRSRLRAHFTRGSGFTELHKPISLHRVEWCKTRSEAKEREIEIADEIDTLTYDRRHIDEQPDSEAIILRKWSENSEKKIWVYGGEGRGSRPMSGSPRFPASEYDNTILHLNRKDSAVVESDNFRIELLGYLDLPDMSPIPSRIEHPWTIFALEITNFTNNESAFPMAGELKVVDTSGFEHEGELPPGITDTPLSNPFGGYRGPENPETEWTALVTNIDTDESGYFAYFVSLPAEKVSKIIYQTGLVEDEFGDYFVRPDANPDVSHIEKYALNFNPNIQNEGLPDELDRYITDL